MKNLYVLYAGNITGYASEPLSSGCSALELSLNNAFQAPDTDLVLLLFGERSVQVKSPQGIDSSRIRVCQKPFWTKSVLFETLSDESKSFDNVYFLYADNPFADAQLTGEMYGRHCQYGAEFSFADGYPAGLCPDILASGILAVLAKMARETDGPFSRTVIFDTIKQDINSFDIETLIAPADLRPLRLSLACDTKRNYQLCRSLTDITAANYAALVSERSAQLRTLPSFYAIQVSGPCPFECRHCPYPQFCRSGKGKSPGISAVERSDFMDIERFAALIADIAAFSEDAVISLSLWGECALHPRIADLVKVVLSYPGLSVLIETTGVSWSAATLEAIAAAAKQAPTRQSSQPNIAWIVSLDAISCSSYAKQRSIPDENAETVFASALNCVDRLFRLFPGAVWPQMIRMKDNEVELESFYRLWKEKTGQVIIQKHDSFCGSIEDRRVADLSPLTRQPCWHIKRDLSILIDGTVPLCREDIYGTFSAGNACEEGIAAVWDRLEPVYVKHTGCQYEGLCGNCDEYYTYNF